MKKLFKLFLTYFICIFAFLLTACNRKSSQPVTVSDFLFNTYISLTVYDEEQLPILKEALEMCREYEQIFSRTLTTSDLSILNSQKSVTNVNPDLYDLIEQSLYYCELTNGSLDISIEPLTSLWNITSSNPAVPADNKIKEALAKVDYNNIILDDNNLSITLEGDSSIDLGAIAKGYVADKIKYFLLENGVTSGIIDFGGNIVCIGTKPDGIEYVIGIKEPSIKNTSNILALDINDMSVVTSGTYERYFIENEQLYHHIIDTNTGYPADNNLASVTIISQDSLTGDCLSTACLVMGRDEALRLLNSIDNVYGILIDEQMCIYYSDGAEQFIH